jgi:hypothetical protein
MVGVNHDTIAGLSSLVIFRATPIWQVLPGIKPGLLPLRMEWLKEWRWLGKTRKTKYFINLTKGMYKAGFEILAL